MAWGAGSGRSGGHRGRLNAAMRVSLGLNAICEAVGDCPCPQSTSAHNSAVPRPTEASEAGLIFSDCCRIRSASFDVVIETVIITGRRHPTSHPTQGDEPSPAKLLSRCNE